MYILVKCENAQRNVHQFLPNNFDEYEIKSYN